MAPDVAKAHRDRVEGLGGERFEALVAELAPALYRFALALALDPHAAEDLVQETFLRAFERRETFRADAAPLTWKHRILHNLAIDRARRSDREVLADDVEDRWRDDTYTVDSAVVVQRAETLRGVPLRGWEARGRVSDYLDGELDQTEVALVERHLRSCPRARPCTPRWSACRLGSEGSAISTLSSRPAWRGGSGSGSNRGRDRTAADGSGDVRRGGRDPTDRAMGGWGDARHSG